MRFRAHACDTCAACSGDALSLLVHQRSERLVVCSVRAHGFDFPQLGARERWVEATRRVCQITGATGAVWRGVPRCCGAAGKLPA